MLFVAGVDEAGRGPLAGPVTASCVAILSHEIPEGVTDSKALGETARERLEGEIRRRAIAYSTVSVGPRRIESLNIRGATIHAMTLAAHRVWTQLVERFGSAVQLALLTDGNLLLETTLQQEPIIKGDAKIRLIGAASILAKTERDRIMRNVAQSYPGYEFEIHKGYPTPRHRKVLEELLPSRIHRRSFAGVRELLPLQQAHGASASRILRAEVGAEETFAHGTRLR